VHLRRALLLFAIVLGLAALATSVSRPPRKDSENGRSAAPRAPEATPAAPSSHPAELRLPGPRGRRSVSLAAGNAGTLVVSVGEPGEVELPGLGLSAPAEPLTPARFELIGDAPGSYRVRFTPAENGEPRTMGRLVVGDER
jgi:hypothetical protein